jgi:hypothetical protein
MAELFWSKSVEYGLLGVVICAVIVLLYKIVMWTLATTKEILAQAAKERECFTEKIAEVTKALDSHSATAREFHNQVVEAHKFQREEHKEMIISLGRINGYKRV